jgi:prolyl oligopeptidase
MTLTNLAIAADDDPYLWLEDVAGDKALDWVRSQNAVSSKELEALPTFAVTRDRLLSVYDSDERIPGFVKMGPHLYNFWRDKQSVRGIWRRTTLAEYKKPAPVWETVLDIDALAAKEQENWVWNGIECLYPTYDRCLVNLSRGGGDTFVVREFDVPGKTFVADGFTLPAAKSRVTWRDRDTLFVGTDFGPGSLTSSGYPRIVKSWQRGTPLTAAALVFEGAATDVSVVGIVDEGPTHHRELIVRGDTFYTSKKFLYIDGKSVPVQVPDDATIGSFNDQLLVRLRTEWDVGGKTYPAGALLATGWEAFMNGRREFAVLFEPTSRSTLSGYSNTKNFLILNVLDNIRSRIEVLSLRNGAWSRDRLAVPEIGTTSARAFDEYESDEYVLSTTDFVTPSSLFLGKIGDESRTLLKQLPSYFDTKGLKVSQHEATSKDGTRVPYFQVSRANIKLDGSNPTLMYGYGGFQISYTSSYNPGMGLSWLEQGGVYILTNIRGGGEFGPTWHQAALKENRQRAYDDFIAIAEDLIKRKVTSPKHLGMMGGSNGGLLVGAILTQRPDLFGAVVCQVPLLDMRRYHKLLAGASWMAEYGDPDKPDEWSYISKYSPYQNVSKDKRYPRVLFTTSTRDDRVHPGHARKMMARMKEQGHDVLLYENIEGGHGGAANNQQAAYMNALAYSFLLKELK